MKRWGWLGCYETIGRLERGHSQPSFAKMCEIAAALGTDLGALSAGAEFGPHADAVDKLTAIARARSVQDIELLIETAKLFFRRLDDERPAAKREGRQV